MIEYKKGDVFAATEPAIIHGCNCFWTMGAGVARQVKTRFAAAYEADKKSAYGDKSKLGTFTYADVDGIAIINAYTQYNWAYERYSVTVDYDAVRTAMENICQFFDYTKFAMPKIGAGLAGGKWPTIERILIEVSDKYNKTFVVYEL